MEVKKNLKKIPTEELAEAMLELLREGYEVQVLVSGSSMSPFLADCRDSVTVSPLSGRLRRGDIVFYKRLSGMIVMHRIIGIDSSGRLTMCGDAQLEKEYPVLPAQVFGVVKKAERKGRRINQRHLIWWLFRCPWRWFRFARRRFITFYMHFLKKK